MANALTISKTRNDLPPYVDFTRLREEGIQHLEKLSTALWTDFNLHDPGITFLELLCYAITDLGYRNAFDTAKLLARAPERRAEADNNFFSAAELLTCNPVTILDYRKLLLDVPGVRNAWLEPAEAGESDLPVYIDFQRAGLTYDPPGDEPTLLPLRGLYKVCLELDPETVRDACGHEYLSSSRIVEEVRRVLHQHRNLAEDFLAIEVMKEEEIAVCADLELDASADPEEILTEVYLKLDAFLSPRLTYHRLQDLLAKGKTPEEIFAGRPFRYQPLHLEELMASDPDCPPDAFDLRPYHPDSFGFIDTDELEALEMRTVLHSSDFYRLILDVPGVKAVKKLSLINYINDLPQSQGDPWCLHLTDKHSPVLSLKHARITFFKQDLPFQADRELVEQQFLERKVAHTKAKLAPHELDLVPPPGEYVDLADYPSIQKDLPQVYGVGEAGLPESATPERKGQAKQLKGYLTFFDQILADYLAQLSHVRDLFSLEKECSREQNGRRHTYFTQALTDLPDAAEIIRNYRSCDSALAGEEVPIDYPPYLQHISESEEAYLTRRNRFLDHLLARFSEDFTDYVLLMYQLRGKGEQQRGIIQDKIDFLRNYPQLSRDRGKAFNYALPGHTWDTNNVSGFKQRVAKLLGMDDASRRHYSHAHVVRVETGYQWELWLGEDLFLRSVPRYPSEEAAQAAFDAAWSRAADETAYFRYQQGEEHGFALGDATGETLAVHPQPYDSAAAREAARWQLIAWVRSNGIPLQVEAATECFFYEIYRQADDGPWLRATQGHEKASEAQTAWQEQALPAAGVLLHFDKLDLTEAAFAFRLLDSEDTELARTVQSYATAAERDLRRRELFYCLNAGQAICHTPGTPGTFRFALMAPDGETVWLESARTFNRVQAAKAAFNRFLPLAGSRVYYHLIDEAEGDLPYSFAVWNRQGEVIATHPQGYATACERDLVIDAILHFLSNELCLKHAAEEDERWHFWVEDEAGTRLLEGIETFEQAAKAEAALRKLTELAREMANYHKLDELEGDCPFGFVLQNEGEDFATHPRRYEKAAERDRAIESLLLYFSDAQPVCALTGEPGRYRFWWGEPEEVETDLIVPLLISVRDDFPDPDEARYACEELAKLARDPRRFARLTQEDEQFSFELRNQTGEVVARHASLDAPETPLAYATEAERDAMIDLIMVLAGYEACAQRIINPEGAYFPTLTDEAGHRMWIGTAVAPSAESAQVQATTIQALAQDRAHYQLLDQLGQPCPYGFALTSEGITVARHPRQYSSEAARDQAIDELLRYRDAPTQARVLTATPHQFSFEIGGKDQLVWLRGPAFASLEAAALACDAALVLAAQPDRFGIAAETEGEYLLSLYDAEGAVVATHPTEFASLEDVESYLQTLLRVVQTRGHAYQLLTESEGVRYQIEGPDLGQWQSAGLFADEVEAFEQLVVDLPLFAALDAHHIAWDDEACDYYLTLQAEGETRAMFTAHQPDIPTAQALIESLLSFFRSQQVPCLTTELAYRYQVEMVGQAKEPLLHIPGSFASEAEAKQAYAAVIAAADGAPLVMAGQAQRPMGQAHFLLRYENDRCRFSFTLYGANGAVLAQAPWPGWFDSRQLMHDYLQEIQWIAREKSVQVEVSGSSCGHYVHLPLSEGGGNADERISSLRRYPTESWAWEAAAHLAPLLRDPARWEADQPQAGSLRLSGPEGQPLMEGSSTFTVSDLLGWLDTVEAPAPKLTRLPMAYHAELRRESDGAVLLRSSEGVPAWWARSVAFFPATEEGREALEQLAIEMARHISQQVRRSQLGSYVVAQGNGCGFRWTFTPSDAPSAPSITLESVRRYPTSGRAEEALARTLQLATLARNRLILAEAEGYRLRIVDQEAENKAWEQANLLYERALDAVARDDAENKDKFQFQAVVSEACASRSRLRLIFQEEEKAEEETSPEQEEEQKEAPKPSKYLEVAHYPGWLDSVAAGEAMEAEIRRLADDEGFHVLEHLLLRPRDRGMARTWYVAWEQAAEGEGLGWQLRTAASEPSQEKARATLQALLRAITGEGEGICKIDPLPPKPEKDAENHPPPKPPEPQCYDWDQKCHSFAIRVTVEEEETGKTKEVIFDNQTAYLDAVERDEAIEQLKSAAQQIQAGEYDREAISEPYVGAYQADDDPRLIPDGFLPIQVENQSQLDGEAPCLTGVDPYSFRLTLVFPYWPSRFRENNLAFRRFCERTIRLEAPAHLAVKICWLDARQLRAFETKYRRWLAQQALAASTYEPCERTQALNDLLAFLPTMNNRYPQATLHDCEESGPEDNPLILNSTSLGTANN